MGNPFLPGSKKVSIVTQGLSSKIVDTVAVAMGMDRSKIDLETETQALIQKADISAKNHDHAGYLYYIQRGVFLSVFCGSAEKALDFARRFLENNNPDAVLNIDIQDVTQLAALYSSLLSLSGLDKIKHSGDEEQVIRSAMIEKANIHAAAKIVARFARISAHLEGDDNLGTVRDLASRLFAYVQAEPTQNPHKDGEVSRVLAASMNETTTRYARVCAENSPGSYASFVMQAIYDYCVFVNIGFYRVTALSELLLLISAFAKERNSTRLGDIPKMIEQDFRPNPQYGE